MIQTQDACLVLIDVQGKLAQLMDEREIVLKNLLTLIQGIKLLDIPILWTEQLPDKIGPTIAPVAKPLESFGLKPIIKETYSCWLSLEFQQQLKALDRRKIIIVGIESHVCVYQTVSHLIENHFNVHLVVDCVSARTHENRWLGIKRMKQLGAHIAGVEMLLCELMQTTRHPKFKEILQLIK